MHLRHGKGQWPAASPTSVVHESTYEQRLCPVEVDPGHLEAHHLAAAQGLLVDVDVGLVRVDVPLRVVRQVEPAGRRQVGG